MNTNSLQAHYQDILADNELLSSTVVCLQETWTKPEDTNNTYQISDKTCHLNSIRRGAGLSTYFSQDFTHLKDITAMSYQITAITSENITVINIYRSSDANNKTVIKSLNSIIEIEDKSIILCGDFNFCHRDQIDHPIYVYLLDQHFYPSMQPPKPTHRDGCCLDMIWTKDIQIPTTFSYLNFVYYTDHSQCFLTSK